MKKIILRGLSPRIPINTGVKKFKLSLPKGKKVKIGGK